MVFVPQAANWLFLLFSFQISSSSAFYAEKVFAPIQLLKGNDRVGHRDQAGTGNDVLKSLMDEGDAALDGGQAVGRLGGEGNDGVRSDKRRLGSALNIGRGRGHLQKVNGKRVSDEEEEGEFGGRLFQLHGQKTAVVGQLVNSEQKEGDNNNNEQVEEDVEDTSDVDRRNIGSAMNLIKVRKNDILRRMSPLAAAAEGDPSSSSYFEEERDRRRLGSAMNLKKVTQDRMKSRLIRE